MLSQYCYVIVGADGYSRLVGKAPGADVLTRLLQDGWRPVRETPMGGDSRNGFALVLLEMPPKT